MPNSKYNATGVPATGAGVTSAQFRNEFALIEVGFDDVVDYVHPNHTGDVTSVADGATTIANKVTMTATAPVLVSGTPTVIATGAVAISLPAATNSAAGHATAAHIQAIEANTAKLTNATHTGDVTGSGALTIAAKAVTAAKIADTTITAAQIAAGTITATQLASKTVTAAVIADNTITYGHVASNTLLVSNLATEAKPLGAGQTYTSDIKASRTAGETQYNTSGRPIQVIINIVAQNLEGGTLWVNGIALGLCGYSAGYYQLTGIVPTGGSYSHVLTGTSYVASYYELK